MNELQALIDSSHFALFENHKKYYDCIESCFECASSCWICADASLNEIGSEKFISSIKTCLATAEICASTAKALISHELYSQEALIRQLKQNIEQCFTCIEELTNFSSTYEHCLISLKCCEQCSKVCINYVNELTLEMV